VRTYFALVGGILYWLLIAPWRGKGFSISAVFHQMVTIGVQALPMASLVSLSIGLTLAMQAIGELSRMGATAYVPDLVGLSLLRELGPLLIGVVVIGRSGSAVAAELGTMKVSEEIEALTAMDIDPVRFLIVPRVLAMLIMLPVLTVFGNYIGIAGGWTICAMSIDMNTTIFITRLLQAVHPIDLYSGMIKSIVFAWLIITISCQAGLAVSGGAEGVGKATTSSVVVSILAMLVANAILTAFFFLA